jgi:hypothetical protein
MNSTAKKASAASSVHFSTVSPKRRYFTCPVRA